MSNFEYKFNEGKYLSELEEYIRKTYSEHYSSEKYQATDMIMDAGHGLGFCIGNVMKYAKRFGKKNGYERKDLLKMLHYTILAMYDAEERGLFIEPQYASSVVNVYGTGISYSNNYNGCEPPQVRVSSK